MAITYVHISSQLIVKTAVDWAADTTVYGSSHILITSDVLYTGVNTRKFKIADGINQWSDLSYFPDLFLNLPKSYYNGARFVNTGNITENIAQIIHIEPSVFLNKIFSVFVKTITSNNAQTKTFRMYFNSTPDLSGTPILAATYDASTAGGVFSRIFKSEGMVIRNYVAPLTTFGVFETSTTSTVTENTLSVNMTLSQYVIITVQNASSAQQGIVDFTKIKSES